MMGLHLATALALAILPQSSQGSPSAQPDSSDLLAQARAAQADFERRRRRLLPVTYSSHGACQERIGRFCYWYDDRDTTMPPEPPPVVPARERLLGALDSLHAALPGDDWILGQRVRYLVEHGDANAAAALTGHCAPGQWWCHALGGFALHALERYAEAERSFDQAVGSMPDEVRCEWTDWTDLLDGDLYDRFRQTGCDARAALADSILWLATPLLSRPGNDLRTELMSRRVVDWLLRGSRSPQAMSWGRDVSELIVRYGWPVRWSTAGRSHPAAFEAQSVVGHEPTPAFAFFPVPSTDPPVWEFDLSRERPRSRYAPGYARRFEAIGRHQIARFPRGDSTLLVLAADLRADTAFGHPFDLAGVASGGPGSSAIVERRPAAGGDGVVMLRVPAVPLLVGIEAEAAEGRFARTRAVVDPVARESGFQLSDLLLFRPGESLPASLEEAATRALPSARWPRARPVGIYWELTGPGADSDSLEVAVSVVPERRGLLGRIGQSLSLVKGRAPLTIEWQLETGQGPAIGRVFELDLAELSAGSYTLVLTVATPDGVERISQREIELLR